MKSAFEQIEQGLQEAIDHAQGGAPDTRIHRPRPIDVKAVLQQPASRDRCVDGQLSTTVDLSDLLDYICGN